MSGEWTVIDRDQQRCREELDERHAKDLVTLLEREGYRCELIGPDGTERTTERDEKRI